MRTLALLAFLFGCGGSEDAKFAKLFEVSAQATTSSSLTGVWGGELTGLEQRWVLRADQVTFAQRCGTTIVGVEAKATITATKIQVHEAKRAESNKCHVAANVDTFDACTPAFDNVPCFVQAANKLRLHTSQDSFYELTKLAD